MTPNSKTQMKSDSKYNQIKRGFTGKQRPLEEALRDRPTSHNLH